MILLQFKRTFPNLTRYTYIAEYSAVVGESYLDQLAFELFTCKLGDLTCSYFYQTILLQFKITFPNLKRYTSIVESSAVSNGSYLDQLAILIDECCLLEN